MTTNTTSREGMINELFMNELKKAYGFETAHAMILSKMAKAATNEELKFALEEHQDVTEMQVTRIEEIFRIINQLALGDPSEKMDSLIEEAERILERDSDPIAKDSAIISIAKRMETFECNAYNMLRTYADKYGNKDVHEFVLATIDEERYFDKELTNIMETALSKVTVS
jgi:ferritin-like metal-binding protein YciE